MSSRTPQECVKLAVDSSADPADRESAIDTLEAANECDELADIVSNGDIEERFRRQALDAVGRPQCRAMLERLVEDGSLDAPLAETAEELLAETDDTFEPQA